MNEKVEEIKHFNRFYTSVMGILNLYSYKSAFSATEAMILYQISKQSKCTAVHLSEVFDLDKGYISRILKRFEKLGLIEKTPSFNDRRLLYIELSEKGEEVLNKLARRASDKVSELIVDFGKEELEELVSSMKRIEEILKPKIR